MRRIGQRIGSVGLVTVFIAAGGGCPMPWRLAWAQSDEPSTNPLSGNQMAILGGRSWYRAVCGNCHGERADGAGESGHGADLRIFSKGFRKFVGIVKDGKETGDPMKMPAWGRVLSDEQIYQIGAYLETLAQYGA